MLVFVCVSLILGDACKAFFRVFMYMCVFGCVVVLTWLCSVSGGSLPVGLRLLVVIFVVSVQVVAPSWCMVVYMLLRGKRW